MRRIVRALCLSLVAAQVACATRTPETAPTRESHVSREPFGTTPAGEAVELVTLTNAHGVEMRVMTYGGIIVSLRVPDRSGKLGDVVLG